MTQTPPKYPVDVTDCLAGKRVTVVGLGNFGGGVGLTRWLCHQGAIVTVSDKADAASLEESIKALNGFGVNLHLGGHDPRDFLHADLLVVNPAVPKEMPLLAEAQAAGVPRTSEINLFLQRCPAVVVGVTGTIGKSTTTAMIGEILRQRFCVHVGGNIGRSLLETLPRIEADHLIVLELSSFQLEDLPLIGISPHIAIVTNLMPNHLDRHGRMENYAQAKKNIFAFQSSQDVLILNRQCQATVDWAKDAPGRVDWFHPENESFPLALPGDHNQANAQAAWAVARQFDLDRETAAAALAKFSGLPHRLELVIETHGVKYYNDSKCTTPESAITALRAFPDRTAIILVGGYDKSVSFEALGQALARYAKAAVAMGQTADKIVTSVEKHRSSILPDVKQARNLTEAVELAKQLAEPGDVVLLSPACASYDMFQNYEKRGEQFVDLVRSSVG